MESKKHTYLPLSIENGNFFIIEDDLKFWTFELEDFLDGIEYMNNLDFAKKVMLYQEVKSNNTVEGYLDDISLVSSIIKHPSNILNEEQKRRILNLYNGYQYILNNKEINQESLKELYNILSKGLINKEDLNNMGDYYRKNPVYIFYSSSLNVPPAMGVDAKEIESKMQQYFDFLNKENKTNCITDEFIKSQIAHFYFCFIHPYYDINGRTSRTLSMWYLLNKKAYPFIIFNRAIQLDKNTYYKVIREGQKYHNITYFLNYLLKNTRLELEKEYLSLKIADNCKYQLTTSDYQALYYILSMKGNLTYFDFATFYNHLNNKQNSLTIYKNMLESLEDKNIIVPTNYTNNHFNQFQNRFFKLAQPELEKDTKIKYLQKTI